MGFRVSVFGLQFPVLWFPVLWLDHVCVLKSSHGQSVHHDLCLDSIENGISSFCLRFMISRTLISRPFAWSCLLLKSSQGQSFHHDLCLDSFENGIMGCHLTSCPPAAQILPNVHWRLGSRTFFVSTTLLKPQVRHLCKLGWHHFVAIAYPVWQGVAPDC